MLNIKELNNFSKNLLSKTKEIIIKSESAHMGSSLSLIHIMSYLFVNYFYKEKYNKDNYFILSKGHASAVFYSSLYLSKIISKKLLDSYGMNNTELPGHVTKIKSINKKIFSTGSLGHGLPYATGLAFAQKKNNSNKKVFVIISDGEINEGTTWESILIASRLSLDNLTIIIDYNGFQSYEKTSYFYDMDNIYKSLLALKFNVKYIDGHSFSQIDKAIKLKTNKTKIIIANTIKGLGMEKLQGTLESHYLNK